MTRREREIAAENRRLVVVLLVALVAFGLVVSLGGCRRRVVDHRAPAGLEAPAAPAAAPEDLEGPVCTGPDCLPPPPR